MLNKLLDFIANLFGNTGNIFYGTCDDKRILNIPKQTAYTLGTITLPKGRYVVTAACQCTQSLNYMMVFVLVGSFGNVTTRGMMEAGGGLSIGHVVEVTKETETLKVDVWHGNTSPTGFDTYLRAIRIK